MTLGERCSVVLQMVLYGLAQAFNLLTDVGIFVDTSKTLPNCDELISYNLTNGAGQSLRCSGGNFTSNVLDDNRTDLRILQLTLAAFFLLGGALFLTQLFMYFKYLVAVGSPTFEHDIDDSPFLQRFYKVHGVLLALEAVVHDIPVGLIVIEICALVWREPNCWACVAMFSSGEPNTEVSLTKTNLWLGIKLASLAPITFFKGMFPLFIWIGGPFCGMDCYICRICTVVPGGFLATVLLLTPLCGAILHRLVPIASGIDEGVPNTVWSIGLIFWAIVIIIGTLLCVFCVPACRRCCFRHGPCKWCGLDCCGLGGEKKRETIKKEDAEV